MQISDSEFQARRSALLKQMQPDSIALIPAAQLVTRSRDTEFPFRQDSYFQYMCGFPEPDAYLVLSNHGRYNQKLSVLFCLAKDPVAEVWQGRRIGPEQATDKFSVDLALPLDEMPGELIDLVDGHQHLYFATGHSQAADELVEQVMTSLRGAPKQTKQAPTSVVDIRMILDEMRLHKSPEEIQMMQKASAISEAAHSRAMRFSGKCAQANQPVLEAQLEAEIHHEFAMQGAKYPAYGTIVGGGDNACILHYTENNQVINSGDLVLIDAGCEWQGYAADITRTFPVNGVFSPEQKQLYQLVLDAQLASFNWIKPGNTLKQATDCAIQVITQGLIELGLLSGSLEDNIEEQTYRAFFMHGLGHWLGLDVHDVGQYKQGGQDRPLSSGMVLTIEPGIYVSPDADVAPKWRGIGIRIEDNLLVTDTGYINLTGDVPKTITEIEGLMAVSSESHNG